MDFETRAIHEGQQPDPATGAITVPIYQTSTFVQDAVGENKGYDYSRSGNPTRTALQLCLASLEGAQHGAAFSSGLGAVTTLMHLVNPGDRVVCVNDVYGGVYRMFSQIYAPKGYEIDFVPDAEVAAAIDERTRLVW
ncbi:MAG TPA: PLP-dependent transferase, partial [Gaiellaceae bacterium]